MIHKHLTSSNTNKYIDVLQKIINEYNNKYHGTIKMSPIDASKIENLDKVREIYKPTLSDSLPKYKVGDRVRISKYKKHFEKGSTPNWTNEICIVSGIKNTNPITYTIKDLNNENILGSFYSQELQHTKF